MTNAIYFDLDGTVYDLYGVNGWLDMLQAEDVTAYTCGDALYDMAALDALLREFVALGVTIGVITWAAMGGSREYNRATRAAKREWVAANMPSVTEFHCVKYGTPKHQVRNIKNSILVDDNADVRAAWNGETINANEDILEKLEILLDMMRRK